MMLCYPLLYEGAKLLGFLHEFFRLGLCHDLGRVIVEDVTLAPTRIKVARQVCDLQAPCGLCYASVPGDWPVAAASSCGSPRIKSLAPSSTEARKWSLARSFVANSSQVYKVGFTARLRRLSVWRSAGASSAKPTLPIIMRSTSLVASSSARTTEP